MIGNILNVTTTIVFLGKVYFSTGQLNYCYSFVIGNFFILKCPDLF